MAEIVNLRQARKQKARADKEARATENRVTFGRTKAEKTLTKAEQDLREKPASTRTSATTTRSREWASPSSSARSPSPATDEHIPRGALLGGPARNRRAGRLSIQALIGRIDAERGRAEPLLGHRVFVLDDLRRRLSTSPSISTIPL